MQRQYTAGFSKGKAKLRVATAKQSREQQRKSIELKRRGFAKRGLAKEKLRLAKICCGEDTSS